MFRSICIKESLAPRIPVLKDLEEGLQHLNLLSSVKNHPELFIQVFTPSSAYEITAEAFVDGLSVVYSTGQSLKGQEEDIFKYFTDFIFTLEHGGKISLLKFIRSASFLLFRQGHLLTNFLPGREIANSPCFTKQISNFTCI